MQYIVSQNKKFCKALRRQAAKTLSSNNHKENLDQFITIEQCGQILENNCVDRDERGRFIVDEDCYVDMLIEISRQIYQSALSKLAAENIIQCAWDEKENGMVFWVVDDNGYRKIETEPS
jgi:hypothetical protein